jgi:phosphate-selective porin OprO/OprP
VQAEYNQTQLQRSSSPDLKFDGWYVFTSYFLTGESRPYKKGVFDRIKPLHAVGNGGIGAWELAARYSTADLNDADIYGGEIDNATLGLNWYTTDNVRFSANYIRVLDVNRPGSDVDGIDGDILALRAQFDF